MREPVMVRAAAWWFSQHERLQWRQLDEPEALAAGAAAVLAESTPDPPLRIAAPAVSDLRAALPADRCARYAALREIAAAHGPRGLDAGTCAGIPHRLWLCLLERLDIDPATPATPATAPTRTGAAQRDTAPAHGGSIGAWIEWWGLPAHPGACYDGRLWAWGAVQAARPEADDEVWARRAPAAELARLSPRVAWRPVPGAAPDGARWHVHPLLARVAGEHGARAGRPRLEEGPGFLLACILDALAELLPVAAFTPRDLAVLWGSLLLPLLAPSRLLPPGDGRDAGRGDAAVLAEPDYMQTVAFHLLHPRSQRLIAVLDQLCTLLVAGDVDPLAEILRLLGREPRAVDAGVRQLVADMVSGAHHRHAAEGWDSGFGFRLLRSVLRAAVPRDHDGADFVPAWDREVHGPPPGPRGAEPGLGALAERLREAMSTALWFPGRPPYPGGPAVRQILDLVWLRWTNGQWLA
jgi:hypothetical protein